MIICSCNGLSDRDIAKVIDDGASRLTELYARKKCQVQCGNCVKNVKCIFKDELAKRKRVTMTGNTPLIELYPQPCEIGAAPIVHDQVR